MDTKDFIGVDEFMYVSTITFTQDRCDDVVFSADACNGLFDCPSKIRSGFSINFDEFAFTPTGSNITFTGTYVTPGTGSIYETGLEWSADIGPAGECTVFGTPGAPISLTFEEGSNKSTQMA